MISDSKYEIRHISFKAELFGFQTAALIKSLSLYRFVNISLSWTEINQSMSLTSDVESKINLADYIFIVYLKPALKILYIPIRQSDDDSSKSDKQVCSQSIK